MMMAGVFNVFFDSMLWCLIILLAVFCLASHRINKWTRKGIPIADPLPLVGNIKDVILGRNNLGKVIKDFYDTHKNKPFITFFAFTEPLVMICDLDIIKSVMIKDFSYFTDRSMTGSENDPLSVYNIFSSQGREWKNLRAKLAPAFSSGKMKKMFKLVDECGKNYVTYLERIRDSNGCVEMKDATARYTTDAIASTTLGLDSRALSDENSDFRRILSSIVTFTFFENIKATMAFFWPWAIKKFGIILTKPEPEKFVRETVWNTVEYRKNNNESRGDLLDLLIQIRDKGMVDHEAGEEDDDSPSEKIDLDGDKLVAQSYIFLLAGFETSATTMTYALYEMALNPDIQVKVHNEISTVLAKHKTLSYEAIQEMTYLHLVIQETLRKYPVLPFLDRRAVRSYRLPGTGIVLEKGQSVVIPVLGLHRDPALYPDPQRFDPMRFAEENKSSRPTCSFLGFGEGPRICLGMRMGYIQSKVGLIYTLINYEVKKSASTPDPLVFDPQSVLNTVLGGINLQLIRRKI